MSGTDRTNMNRGEPVNDLPPDMPVAALLRAAADGELDAAGLEFLRRHLDANPADVARVEFEVALRRACGRALAGDPSARADTGLRTRIQAVIENAGPTPATLRMEPVVVRARSDRGGVLRVIRPYMLQLAALLVIVASVTVIVREVRREGTYGAGNVASFVSQEHLRCVMSDTVRESKLRITDSMDVPARLRSIVGRSPSIPDFEKAGFRFEGAGTCGVPGPGKSAHLIFVPACEHKPAAKCGSVSLFVQQGPDYLGLSEDHMYELEPQNGSEGEHAMIFVWKHDGLLYYLAVESEKAISALRESVGLPPTAAKKIKRP